jgi:hypothetical protein
MCLHLASSFARSTDRPAVDDMQTSIVASVDTRNHQIKLGCALN